MSKYRFLIAGLFFIFSCGEEPEVKEVVKPQPVYYYYPKANVYIDSANLEYLYLAIDKKTWQKEKQIPAVMQSMLDKGILIEKPSDPVWRDNENHKLVYSAVLYATPGDTAKPKPKPVVKPVEKTEEPKNEKKGIRKFFDKIFNKKNKN